MPSYIHKKPIVDEAHACLPEHVHDLSERLIHKAFQMMNLSVGALELACRRSRQGGIHEAYEAICKEHPEAAKAILKAFHMRENGNYVL